MDATGVKVAGVDNLMIRFSKCCNPVPGDNIVGFITKGRGISVHRKDCTNMISLPEEEKQRFIEVEWDKQKENMSYDTEINILAEDRKGLFSDISKTCDDMDVSITGVQAKSARDRIVTITLTVSISNTSQIEKVLRQLKAVPGIADVYRAIT
jgi:GTP pyrophosphokinase